jgi:hypothetical protein
VQRAAIEASMPKHKKCGTAEFFPYQTVPLEELMRNEPQSPLNSNALAGPSRLPGSNLRHGYGDTDNPLDGLQNTDAVTGVEAGDLFGPFGAATSDYGKFIESLTAGLGNLLPPNPHEGIITDPITYTLDDPSQDADLAETLFDFFGEVNANNQEWDFGATDLELSQFLPNSNNGGSEESGTINPVIDEAHARQDWQLDATVNSSTDHIANPQFTYNSKCVLPNMFKAYGEMSAWSLTIPLRYSR